MQVSWSGLGITKTTTTTTITTNKTKPPIPPHKSQRFFLLLLDVDECISASFCSLSLSSSCSIFANLSRNLCHDYFLWVGPVIFDVVCEANQ
jgi:hypothetical protein